jgi:hypothetical protein
MQALEEVRKIKPKKTLFTGKNSLTTHVYSLEKVYITPSPTRGRQHNPPTYETVCSKTGQITP